MNMRKFRLIPKLTMETVATLDVKDFDDILFAKSKTPLDSTLRRKSNSSR